MKYNVKQILALVIAIVLIIANIDSGLTLASEPNTVSGNDIIVIDQSKTEVEKSETEVIENEDLDIEGSNHDETDQTIEGETESTEGSEETIGGANSYEGNSDSNNNISDAEDNNTDTTDKNISDGTEESAEVVEESTEESEGNTEKSEDSTNKTEGSDKNSGESDQGDEDTKEGINTNEATDEVPKDKITNGQEKSNLEMTSTPSNAEKDKGIMECTCETETDIHLKDCPLYNNDIEITLYERLINIESIDEFIDIINSSDNTEDLNKLTTEEIEELIYYLYELNPDEDQEILALEILYNLDNSPELPWQTLEILPFPTATDGETVEIPAGEYTGCELTSGTYKLTGNIILNTLDLTIPSGQDVTIDLNGFILRGTGLRSVIKVDGSLTIIDSSWELDESDRPIHYGTITDEQTWVINESTYRSGVWNYEEDTQISKDLVAIYGGVITGGYNTDRGGGIYVSVNGKLIFNSGTIAGNKTDNYGGGIYNRGKAVVHLNGGCLSWNHASKGGGGTCLQVGTSDITVDNLIVSHNSTDSVGGGIYSENIELTVTNTEIYSNYASNGGGYNTNSKTIFNDCNFSYNYASNGGAISAVHAIFNSGTIENNTAKINGSALYVSNSLILGSVDCTDSHNCPVINKNTGTYDIYLYKELAPVELNCGNILDNIYASKGITCININANVDNSLISIVGYKGSSYIDNRDTINESNITFTDTTVTENLTIANGSNLIVYSNILGYENIKFIENGVVYGVNSAINVSRDMILNSLELVSGIKFDLSAGNVTISNTTYEGYIFKDGKKFLVYGTHQDNNEYYIYQSNTEDINQAYDEDGIPIYNRVKHGDKYWGEYVTNNTDIAGISDNWTVDATDVGRTPTANRIHITGSAQYNVTIDNIWTTYFENSTGRTKAGISFIPSSSGKLIIKLKGDNRLCAVHYSNRNKDASITFENGDTEESPGSLTAASFSDKQNWWNAVIGSSDSYNDSYNIIINSGIIYAGSRSSDNCTAIGGGGNGMGQVEIHGGTVTAVANTSGTAIGGGIGDNSQGGNANITITNGEIYAYNFGYVSTKFIPSAAIGGGGSRASTGNSSTVIDISGGYVYAQSLGGAAIGGGSSVNKNGGPATINIYGDAIVEAQSIGGTATNGEVVNPGVSIGGGTAGDGGTSNGGNITLNISGGTIHVGSIGGGGCSNTTGHIGSGTVTMSGGTLHGQIVMGAGAEDNTFTMTGGIIDNSLTPISDTPYNFEFVEEDGGAIYIEKGTATIENGEITDFKSNNGGAIYINGGSFEMNGGSIHNGQSSFGGAIYIDSGICEINNGILENIHSQNGGVIYVTGGDLLINGGTINNCYTKISNTRSSTGSKGGAIYVDGGNVEINGGYIVNCYTYNENNEIDGLGGAVYVNDGIITLNDGIIYGCSSTNGGAIYTTGDVFINGGYVYECKAIKNGGALMTQGGQVIMTGGQLVYNDANNRGGAIYAYSTNTDISVRVESGTIADNIAQIEGGAIDVNIEGNYEASIIIGLETCDGTDNGHSHPIIKNNIAEIKGGGFCLHGDKMNLHMYCGSLTENKANDDYGSGNLNQTGGHAIIEGTNIPRGITVNGGKLTCPDVKDIYGYITYDPNYADATELPIDIAVTDDVIITMSNKTFNDRIVVDPVTGETSTLTLIGWSKNAHDTGTGTSFMPVGSEYEVQDETTTLYAIWQIMGAGTALEPVIEVGKNYNYMQENDNTVIRLTQDSSVSLQLEVSDMIPNMFDVRRLNFFHKLAAGTDIIMIDLSNLNSPKYYIYNVESEVDVIDLTEFIEMNTLDTHYTKPTTSELTNETFLFIIDFNGSNTPTGVNTLTLTRLATDGSVAPFIQESTINISDKRKFSMSIDESDLSMDNINIKSDAIVGNESKYKENNLALVIEAIDKLPSDSHIIYNNNKVYLNSKNQFVIQLDTLIESKIDKNIQLQLDTNIPNINDKEYKFNIKLVRSKTTIDKFVLFEDELYSLDFKVDNKYYNTKHKDISYKFNMNNRIIYKDTKEFNINYESYNEDKYNLEYEIQYKLLNNYIQTDTIEIVEIENNVIKLKMSDLALNGTYRIQVNISKDEEIVEQVHYNFIVID